MRWRKLQRKKNILIKSLVLSTSYVLALWNLTAYCNTKCRECFDEWVQELVSTKTCEYKNLWVQELASTRTCEYKNLRVQELASTRTCEYKNLRVQERASTRTSEYKNEYKNLRVQQLTDIRTCKYKILWVQKFVMKYKHENKNSGKYYWVWNFRLGILITSLKGLFECLQTEDKPILILSKRCIRRQAHNQSEWSNGLPPMLLLLV